ncbi:MAG: sulfatase [Planctomycetaceae bacterium]|nr:sulfatase [Planctomycetales bacterium]MCB9920588.1 sulfatase [Planctomycetaceae bacterium]
MLTHLVRSLLFVLLLSAVATATSPKPNFLFIIADDCTFRDIGCYGGQAHTPNIDRLASEGMRFKQCFQSAPMCSPTRHNIYTGLYPVKSGAYPNHTFVKAGTKSVVHYLKPLGYRVALSGKRHISPADVFPFEYSAVDNNPDLEAIDSFMAECATSDTPFCLFACSNEPHSPWNKGDASRYPPEKVKLPPYFVDTEKTRSDMSAYLAEITYYDWQVGECLKLLDKHGVADNTLVIVVSEQGSSFPFGKWTCYDTGLQSACIVRWPGHVQPGSLSEALIEYIDFLPTFVDAAGGKPAKALQGRSLLPVLSGDKTRHKDFVYGEMTTRGIINGSTHFGIRSIRSERYKYIVNFTPDVEFTNACTSSAAFRSWEEKANAGDADAAHKVHRYFHRPAEELYAVTEDWYEWHNLAEDPKFADIKAELRTQLDKWMTAQGDLGQATELAALDHQVRGGRESKAENTKKKRNKKK